MTKVSAQKSGGWCQLKVQGHATGSQDVCAGVSALVQAFLGYLDNRSDGLIVTRREVRPANVFIRCVGGRDHVAAFEMMIIGFMQIEAANPDYLQVLYEEK